MDYWDFKCPIKPKDIWHFLGWPSVFITSFLNFLSSLRTKPNFYCMIRGLKPFEMVIT